MEKRNLVRNFIVLIALAICVPVTVTPPDIAHAGAKKSAKKIIKRAKKSTNKGVDAARKKLKAAGVTVDSATGEVKGWTDEGVDLTTQELEGSIKKAKHGYEQAKKQVRKAAEKAVSAAYKKAYKDSVGKYAKLFAMIVAKEVQLAPKVTEIGGLLLAGKNKKAGELIEKLRDHVLMSDINEKAHELMGTSLVVTVALGGGGFLPAAGSGVRGIAINLSKGGKPKTSWFVVAGGGLVTDVRPSGATSYGIGFLKGDPSNISGVFVDAAATVVLKGPVSGTVAISWAPPDFNKSPYFKPVPLLTMYGISAGVGGTKGSPGSVFLGSSYTWITQRAKNKDD